MRKLYLRDVGIAFSTISLVIIILFEHRSTIRNKKMFNSKKYEILRKKSRRPIHSKLQFLQNFAKFERSRARIKSFIQKTNKTLNGSSHDLKYMDDNSKTRGNVNNYCPSDPPNLEGTLNIALNGCYVDDLRKTTRMTSPGFWTPSSCTSRDKLAIIIPYRDRKHHLCLLLKHLIPMLQRQLIEFKIFVLEQNGFEDFNKGILMNAGFIEALKTYNFQCCIFHDVDLIPEDDRNLYSCSSQPQHHSVAINKMNYRLQYDLLVGGVLNFRREHFVMVNGFSNEYWGWGAEDDDMAYRIILSGLRITRPPARVSRYTMLSHEKRRPSASRKSLLRTANRRFQMDGLKDVPYSVVTVQQYDLYTYVLINIAKKKH